MRIDKNLPNHLTIIRMVAIPVIVAILSYEDSVMACRLGGIIFAVISLTDFFDGYIAKKYNLVSNFGKAFDPIADKVLVACALIMLVQNGKVSALPCLLIISREFIVSGFREFLAQTKINLAVTKISQVKTMIQMTAITIIIIGSKGTGIKSLDLIGELLLWIAAILSLFSGYIYFKACNKYF
ncbi:MAG: CDP-diacylglycerol--glycerol-3-phosphate 3-phosphatidyltransferase [Rickettsiaceae bacterium]|nr:CDP-diacylglycerol--glycerol-3-phosphate 3-phosphatidyltransferase [Rickettsiaceae bacterium]